MVTMVTTIIDSAVEKLTHLINHFRDDIITNRIYLRTQCYIIICVTM